MERKGIKELVLLLEENGYEVIKVAREMDRCSMPTGYITVLIYPAGRQEE
jgi:hypothetical protein